MELFGTAQGSWQAADLALPAGAPLLAAADELAELLAGPARAWAPWLQSPLAVINAAGADGGELDSPPFRELLGVSLATAQRLAGERTDGRARVCRPPVRIEPSARTYELDVPDVGLAMSAPVALDQVHSHGADLWLLWVTEAVVVWLIDLPHGAGPYLVAGDPTRSALLDRIDAPAS